MLAVKVEIWPYGMEQVAHTIDTIYIGNDGTGTPERGNYDVYTEDPRDQPYPREQRRGWIGKLRGVPRTGPEKNRRKLVALALEMAAMQNEDHDS